MLNLIPTPDCGVLSVNGEKCNLSLCQLRDDAGLRINHRVRDKTILNWDLLKVSGIRNWAPPIEVAIDYSPLPLATDDLWTEMAPYAVRDGVFETDFQLLLGSELNTHFRLRLRDAAGNEYVTSPRHLADDIKRPVYTTYREIIRRWHTRITRGEISGGILLKRRRWGTRCPTCLDRDGRQRIESQCPQCFDVGFDGGYYRLETCFGLEMRGEQVSEMFDFGGGFTQEGSVSQVLFLDIPQVYPGDVWVDTTTDERWLLGSPVKTESQLGNVKLLRTAPAARFPFSHIIYQFDAGLRD